MSPDSQGLSSIEFYHDSGVSKHEIHKPPGLCPRHMKDEAISISASFCFDIGQIETMLEKMYNGAVDSIVYAIGGHYGFVVNNVDVGKRQKKVIGKRQKKSISRRRKEDITVDFESIFFSLYTSPFTSPYCDKQRLKLYKDCELSYSVIIKDKKIVESLMDENKTLQEILTILESAGEDSVVVLDNSSETACELLPPQIERYLNDTETRIPSFLTKPVSFQAKKPHYSKAFA